MTTASKNASATQVRAIRDSQTVTLPVQTTTASYVDLAGSVIDARTASALAYVLKNAHASLTAKYTVYGSIDGITYVVVQVEATIAAAGGTATYSVVNPAYGYYKVGIVDGSGHGTVEGAVITKD